MVDVHRLKEKQSKEPKKKKNSILQQIMAQSGNDDYVIPEGKQLVQNIGKIKQMNFKAQRDVTNEDLSNIIRTSNPLDYVHDQQVAIVQ